MIRQLSTSRGTTAIGGMDKETTEPPLVKCQTCGFLSKHTKSGPEPRFYEIDKSVRGMPSAFFLQSTGGGYHPATVACYAGEFDLMAEVNKNLMDLSEMSRNVNAGLIQCIM